MTLLCWKLSCLTTSLTTSLTTPNPDFYVALDPQCLEDFEHFVVLPGLSILESMVLQKCPCARMGAENSFQYFENLNHMSCSLFEVLLRQNHVGKPNTCLSVFWGEDIHSETHESEGRRMPDGIEWKT